MSLGQLQSPQLYPECSVTEIHCKIAPATTLNYRVGHYQINLCLHIIWSHCATDSLNFNCPPQIAFFREK